MIYHFSDTGGGTRKVGKLYFDPKHPSSLSTFKRLHAAARGRTVGELREWLEAQDAYTSIAPVERDNSTIPTQ